MIEAETADPMPSSDDIDAVEIVTEDATGTRREYRILLTSIDVGWGHVMAGKRVDDGADRNPYLGFLSIDSPPGAPTDAVWSAAADHFREEGHDVHWD